MDLGIAGRTALVCASTSGLGLAVATALAGEGARTVICGRRAELARREAARLPGTHGIGIDLTDPAAPERLVTETVNTLGPVQILVLNSGGPAPGTAGAQTRDTLQAALDLLLLPQQELIRLCLPGMLEAGWGRIIAIGSSGVAEPIAELAQSNTGRAALAAYLKTLAGEVAAQGITVNMLLPGRIATDRVAALDAARAARAGHTVEEERATSQAAIPTGRYGRPEEFGAAAAFLASDRAAYITGTQIRVDGGLIRAT